MMFPSESPEIIPPSLLWHNAETGFECYLNTLEHEFPFHSNNKPLLIDVITELPNKAIDMLGFKGAFPKIPFFN